LYPWVAPPKWPLVVSLSLIFVLCVQQASTIRNEVAYQHAHKGIRPLRQLDVAQQDMLLEDILFSLS
jgi:hypothetical protein